jgi:hypothetical protein
MDDHTFAALSRRVAAAPSRRAVLAVVGLGLTHALRGQPVAAQVSDDAFGFCRLPGAACGRNVQCCAGKCRGDGTCGCRKRGKPAIAGPVCCSGKAKQGKCR